MKKKWHLHRREVLRGFGTAILLPGLEAMLPSRAHAATTNPKRLINVFRPGGNCLTNKSQLPTADYAKVQTDDIKAKINIISRVNNVVGRALDDLNVKGIEIGQGEHGSGISTLYTGQHPGYDASKVSNSSALNWQMPRSYDQVIAEYLNLKSICVNVSPGLSVHPARWRDEFCSTIGWKTGSVGLKPYANPRDVFNLLFSDVSNPNQGDQAEQIRLSRRKSILDFVLGDIGRYNQILGSKDKQKLDEYLTSLREVEKRVIASMSASTPPGQCNVNGVSAPNINEENQDLSREYPMRLGIMQDLCVKAFECDRVQVFNMMLATDGSGLNYSKFLSEAKQDVDWHTVSHFENNTPYINDFKAIVNWQYEQFKVFMLKLDKVKDPDDSSILDNTVATFMSSVCDGHTHDSENLNCILAGSLGGRIKTGQHIQYTDGNLGNNAGNSIQPPATNIWLTIMRAFGLTQTSFGNSKGVINELLT